MTRPVIPVSTLVSGIDNGAVHLGLLKLAWHLKKEKTPSQGSQLARVNVLNRGRMGGMDVGGKVFLAYDKTEYVRGSDLEHCGIMYKYRAYGMESYRES